MDRAQFYKEVYSITKEIPTAMFLLTENSTTYR